MIVASMEIVMILRATVHAYLDGFPLIAVYVGFCEFQLWPLLDDCTVNCTHGHCSWNSSVYGKCSCDPGWSGSACNILYKTCPNDCSGTASFLNCANIVGHGVCDHSSGNCTCSGMTLQPDCAKFYCSGDPMCSGNGVCNSTNGKCECYDNWSGSLCQISYCINNTVLLILHE